MARASTPTKLSLDEWSRLLGIHSLHFNGLTLTLDDQRRGALCQQPWLQFGYMNADKIGREEVATAIAQAETEMEQVLGFFLAPTWTYDEWRPTVRPNRPELVITNFGDIRGYARVAALNNGYFISGGIEAATRLTNAAAVVYNDDDGDGYKERATVVYTTSVTSNPDEIEIHLPPTALAGEYDPANNIRPTDVRVVDNGNGTWTFTIRARREQLVIPEKQTDFGPYVALDAADDGNFAANVEVWRHYNDPSVMAKLLWERADNCNTCNSGSCTACQYGTLDACIQARGDPKLGIVAYMPASFNATTGTWGDGACGFCRDADVVRFFYRSGWTATRSPIAARFGSNSPRMDRFWQRIVAQFAASKLEREACDCENAGDRFEYWQQDLAYSGGAEQLSTFQLSQRDLDNPFGTRRGAVMAWKAVEQNAMARAVLL